MKTILLRAQRSRSRALRLFFGATLYLVLAADVGSQDRIDLESTFIGDREQPSVSYITPWKPPEGPDKLYRPIKSISGSVLEPIDRDVMARSIQYYDELSLEQSIESR